MSHRGGLSSGLPVPKDAPDQLHVHALSLKEDAGAAQREEEEFVFSLGGRKFVFALLKSVNGLFILLRDLYFDFFFLGG